MQDARNVGECLTFKVFLQIEVAALAYLVDDLAKRAWECRAERVHAFHTAHRHRKAIDEAIQRMTAPIPIGEADMSIRLKVAGLITEFYKGLQQQIRAVDTKGIDVTSTGAIDWADRLEKSAVLVEEFSFKVEPLLTELKSALDRKEAISLQIQGALQTMAAII